MVSDGKRFHIAFLPWNNAQKVTFWISGVQLLNTSDFPDSCNVSNNQQLGLNGSCEGIFPNTSGILHDVGIKLHMAEPLHVLQDSGNDCKEGYLAIPDSDLGSEYFVSTYCRSDDICQLAITPKRKHTRVCLQFRDTVNDVIDDIKDYSNCNVSEKDNVTQWTQITCRLQERDVLYIKSKADLTGTFISANNKIAVFAGSQTSRDVFLKGTYLLIEQLPPTSNWGTEFVVVPSSNEAGDIIKIVAQADNTEIYITGFSPFIIPQRSQAFEKRIDKGWNCMIKASKPVLVMQIFGLTTLIVNGSRVFNTTNPYVPSMTIVPAVNHWANKTNVHIGDYSTCEIKCVSNITNDGDGIEGTPYRITSNTSSCSADMSATYTVCKEGPALLNGADWSEKIQVQFEHIFCLHAENELAKNICPVLKDRTVSFLNCNPPQLFKLYSEKKEILL